jgi:hypothetical protein
VAGALLAPPSHTFIQKHIEHTPARPVTHPIALQRRRAACPASLCAQSRYCSAMYCCPEGGRWRPQALQHSCTRVLAPTALPSNANKRKAALRKDGKGCREATKPGALQCPARRCTMPPHTALAECPHRPFLRRSDQPGRTAPSRNQSGTRPAESTHALQRAVAVHPVQQSTPSVTVQATEAGKGARGPHPHPHPGPRRLLARVPEARIFFFRLHKPPQALMKQVQYSIIHVTARTQNLAHGATRHRPMRRRPSMRCMIKSFIHPRACTRSGSSSTAAEGCRQRVFLRATGTWQISSRASTSGQQWGDQICRVPPVSQEQPKPGG